MVSDDFRQLKDALLAQFARVGHAVSTPKRIEILDFLAQAERTVAELARMSNTPVKNTSAHLRALRTAGLVRTRKDGARVYYALADDSVHAFVAHLQRVAHSRLAEVEHLTRMYLDAKDGLEPVTNRELERRIRAGEVTVIDVRPREEFEAGHIPGAISVPMAELRRGRAALPAKKREIVAYCRGRYCILSVDAVTLLRKRGYRARRLIDGLPGWRWDGRRVETSAPG